nr:hypothetical protein [uncultured bacterium]
MLRTVAALIQSGLDIILPRKERVVRIDSYRAEDIPVSPAEHEACGVRITTLMQYREEAVADCIKALKYDRAGIAAALLADALAEYLREEIVNMQQFSTKPVVLAPVPLHASRERERGFNQVASILDALPREFKDGTLSRVEPHALARVRATPQQTRLSRSERLQNVANAFAAEGGALRGCHIILVDDVTTTGATLAAAAQPLAGESVTLLALAHA